MMRAFVSKILMGASVSKTITLRNGTGVKVQLFDRYVKDPAKEKSHLGTIKYNLDVQEEISIRMSEVEKAREDFVFIGAQQICIKEDGVGGKLLRSWECAEFQEKAGKVYTLKMVNGNLLAEENIDAAIVGEEVTGAENC